MKLTLRESLTFGGLQDAEVIAGHLHLDREIVSISILEIADPMVTQWVSHHELYISSFYSIQDNLSAQEQIIKVLANCGCTGLIIGHLGLWFNEIPQLLIDLCNRLQFPLVVANPKISYLEIMNPIIKRLMNWTDKEVGYINIRKDILDIALQETNAMEGIKKIPFISNTMMSIFDSKFICLYSNKTEIEHNQEKQMLEIIIHDKLDMFESGYSIDYCVGIQKLVIPIFEHVRSVTQGYIVINIANENMESTLKLVDTLRIAFSILLSRKLQLLERKISYKQDYWEHLAKWDFRSEEAALEMGQRVGIDLSNIHHMIVLRCHDNDSSQLAPDEQKLQNTISRWLINRSKAMISAITKNNFTIFHNEYIIHLLEDCQTDPDYSILAGRFLKLFSETRDVFVTVAVGRKFTKLKEIKEIYQQCISSIDISMNYFGNNRIVRYSDVWFIDYLNGLKKDENSVQMCKQMLKPLLEEVNESNTMLIETFKSLLECNDDVSKVASIMNVHRNTIIYRRKKIVDILGSNPFGNPMQFIYYAALNILM
jgi:sugar diacid utilization regulator